MIYCNNTWKYIFSLVQNLPTHNTIKIFFNTNKDDYGRQWWPGFSINEQHKNRDKSKEMMGEFQVAGYFVFLQIRMMCYLSLG